MQFFYMIKSEKKTSIFTEHGHGASFIISTHFLFILFLNSIF